MIFRSSIILGALVATSAFGADKELLNEELRQEAIFGVIPQIELLEKKGADVNSN